MRGHLKNLQVTEALLDDQKCWYPLFHYSRVALAEDVTKNTCKLAMS